MRIRTRLNNCGEQSRESEKTTKKEKKMLRTRLSRRERSRRSAKIAQRSQKMGIRARFKSPGEQNRSEKIPTKISEKMKTRTCLNGNPRRRNKKAKSRSAGYQSETTVVLSQLYRYLNLYSHLRKSQRSNSVLKLQLRRLKRKMNRRLQQSLAGADHQGRRTAAANQRN